MNHLSKINLNQSRDFGQNIEVAIDFAKQNYGVILKAILVLAPIAFISALFINPISVQVGFGYGGFIPSVLMMVMSLLVALYTITYMSEYHRSGGVVEKSKVWARAKYAIVPVVLAGILYGVLVVIGVVLCIVPGIAIAVYLAFYAFEIIENDADIIDSYKSSFALVKDNWWATFVYHIVVSILLGLISLMFCIPLLLPIILSVVGTDSILTSRIFIYVAAVLYSMMSLCLAPLSYIALGTFYYSLRSQKNNNSELDMIDNIGKPNRA